MINFDQIVNQENLLSKFNENSPIKIYGIEVHQERNIVAFRCQGGLFGETELTITLPLKIEVKPDEIFKNPPIDILDEQPSILSIFQKKYPLDEIKPDQDFKSQKKYNPQIKSVQVVVDDKNLEIIIKGNSVIIAIGELRFSLRELKFLYYKYFLGYNDQQLSEKVNPKNNLYFIKTSLINRNHNFISQKNSDKYYTNNLSILLEEVIRLRIMNENFMKKLEKVLAKA